MYENIQDEEEIIKKINYNENLNLNDDLQVKNHIRYNIYKMIHKI